MHTMVAVDVHGMDVLAKMAVLEVHTLTRVHVPTNEATVGLTAWPCTHAMACTCCTMELHRVRHSASLCLALNNPNRWVLIELLLTNHTFSTMCKANRLFLTNSLRFHTITCTHWWTLSVIQIYNYLNSTWGNFAASDMPVNISLWHFWHWYGWSLTKSADKIILLHIQ